MSPTGEHTPEKKPPESATAGTDKVVQVLASLAQSATDPVHKRLIEAYRGDNPYNALVAEFTKILDEVAHGEA